MKDYKSEFEKNGYLILDNFSTDAECDALIKRAAELSETLVGQSEASLFQINEQSQTKTEYFLNSSENISYFFENDAFDEEGILKKPEGNYLSRIGYALHDLDNTFGQFSRSNKLRNLVVDGLGLNDQLIIQSVYIFKHAGIGAGLHLHQDSSFTYTEPDSCVGFWFALETANKENGCLWVKPGGHGIPIRERFRVTEDKTLKMDRYDTTELNMEDFIPLEVNKGACIVLHGMLPHYSLHNTSGKSRQAYAIHTIDEKACYPSDNWLQREKIPLKGF